MLVLYSTNYHNLPVPRTVKLWYPKADKIYQCHKWWHFDCKWSKCDAEKALVTCAVQDTKHLPVSRIVMTFWCHFETGARVSPTVLEAGKIATESKLQLCGWGGQGYAIEGCVDNGPLRPPPPHSSQLGTVYATKRRRRNGKRYDSLHTYGLVSMNFWEGFNALYYNYLCHLFAWPANILSIQMMSSKVRHIFQLCCLF